MRKLVQAFASLSGGALVAVAATTLGMPIAAFAQAQAPAEAGGAAKPTTPGTSAEAGARNEPARPAGQARRPTTPVTNPTTTTADPNGDVMFFAGTCGASAAITLDDLRVIVGSDDDNMIRTYEFVEPADLVVKDEAGKIDAKTVMLHKPFLTENLYKFTKVHQFSKRNFSAIEGAAVGDGLVFWAGSHGRREDGENRPNRRRLFATKVGYFGEIPVLEPYGEPVIDLVQQIEATDALRSIGLSRSIMSIHRRLEHLAPEVRGFQIQALAMAADGKTLLLGLRNPVAVNQAILIPLVNPVEVVEGARAIFAEPILLPLDGRTISAMEWVPAIKGHLIVAGKPAAHDGFVLYRWSGKADERPVLLQELPEGFDVQSFVVSKDATRLLLFSDDSTVMHPAEGREECKSRIEEGMCMCAKLTDPGPKKFRALWVPLDLGEGGGQGVSAAATRKAVEPSASGKP